MSIHLRFAVAIAVAVAIGPSACTTEDPEGENATVQEIGVPPLCPAGQHLEYWLVYRGDCGSCVRGTFVGSKADEYVACSGNISGTTRLSRANLCVEECGLQ